MRGFEGKVCALAMTFLIAGTVSATPLANVSGKQALKNLNDEPALTEGLAGPYAGINELNENVLVGDTLWVGSTWRDMQHNGTIGRMIAVEGEDEAMAVHISWCHRATATGTSKQHYQKVTFNDADEPEFETFNGTAVSLNWGAYGNVVLANVAEAARPYFVYHGAGVGGNDYASILASENAFVPGMYTEFRMPFSDDNVVSMWPHGDMCTYNNEVYAHMLVNGYNPDGDDYRLYYYRGKVSAADATAFENVTPGGGNLALVTDKAMNLSSTVATSDDGSRVVLTQTIGRWLSGEGPASWDDKRAKQANNDIYVWESTDGGETWDWENPLDLTSWANPNIDLMPDTVAASGDTLRAYTELEPYIDYDNKLHIVFNVGSFVFYRETEQSGAVFIWNPRVYHWCEENPDDFTQIVAGDYRVWGQLASWEMRVGHTNVYRDPDTGILWAMWQQYGWPDAFEPVPDDPESIYPYDRSEDGFQNSDIWVAASDDNGLHWTKGVNITDTNLKEPGALPAGECMSEREPSMAKRNPGDYLHITYTLDRDAGIGCPPSTPPEGTATDNALVYHRVSKTELITKFNELGEWAPNYPMHIDGSGYTELAIDWPEDGFPRQGSVTNERTELTPSQFELKANYPNPFNPSTQIAFDLKARGTVKLAIYDVMGREVATLVNRTMEAGAHHITFDAADMASGVYFAKLTSGDASQVRKMMLVK